MKSINDQVRELQLIKEQIQTLQLIKEQLEEGPQIAPAAIAAIAMATLDKAIAQCKATIAILDEAKAQAEAKAQVEVEAEVEALYVRWTSFTK